MPLFAGLCGATWKGVCSCSLALSILEASPIERRKLELASWSWSWTKNLTPRNGARLHWQPSSCIVSAKGKTCPFLQAGVWGFPINGGYGRAKTHSTCMHGLLSVWTFGVGECPVSNHCYFFEGFLYLFVSLRMEKKRGLGETPTLWLTFMHM